MKKIISVFLILIPLFVAAQYTVNISVEHPFTFKPVENAYVKIVRSGQTAYYKVNENGRLRVPLNGKVHIEVASEGFEKIEASFDIRKDMDLGFYLNPSGDFVPQEKPGVFLDLLILDKHSMEPVPQGKITLFANEFTFESDFVNGQFVLNQNNAPDWWTKLPEETEITYYIEAPGYDNFLQTDLIPQVYTVKSVKLIPSNTNKPAFDRPLKNPSGEIIQLFQNTQNRSVESQSACDRLPSVIRVGVNCSCNDCQAVQTMSLQVYVKQGLNDEWIASWHMESLKAGSLPYRTYGAYYVLHPIDPNYDISNTTCKQVWDSDYSTRCYTAADATAGEYLETAGGAMAFSEYSAENNCLNPSTSYPCNCGDGYSGNGTDWPCIQDQVCAGHDRYGHGRGMCQWGSSRWANNGQSYQWIANHYYNPGHIYRCGTPHPNPDFEVTNANLSQNSGNPGDQIQASCEIVNNTALRTDKNVARVYLSSDMLLDAADISLDTTIIWPLNGQSSVTKYFDFQIPQVTSGNYYILFVADPDDQMLETDENNNLQALAFAVGTTAIEENLFTRNLEVFPNPVDKILNVKTKNGFRISEIRVYDTHGRIVLQPENHTGKINISQLSSGIYLFKFTETNGLQGTYKIIKH